MVKKFVSVLCFLGILCLQVAAFATDKAVTVVYYAQGGGTPMIADSWYQDVSGFVNGKLGSFGITADSVDIPWAEFAEKYAGKTVNKEVAHAEWIRTLRARYNVSVNVYVDRFFVGKDGSVDVDVNIAVIRPGEFENVLAHGNVKIEKVKGKPSIEVLQEALSQALEQCKPGLQSTI